MSRTSSGPRRRARTTGAAALAAALLAGLTLGACSGSGAGGGSADEPAARAVGGTEQLGEGDAPDASDSRAGAGQTDSSPVTPAGLLSRDVIQRADLRVRARDVGEALGQVRVVVAGVQGVVADEHTETTRRGDPRRSTLTLRVPADSFDAVVADLGRLGRLGSQQVSTQDVSTEVVDVQTRVVSAERTLRRIRELLEQADDFGDVLSLESELARREADLASLEAQQAYLQDQTSLSTILLTLLPRRGVLQPADGEPAGFVGGLDTGWDALVAIVTVLLTALGVVLPLLLVLGPLALLAWLTVRRLRPAQPPTA